MNEIKAAVSAYQLFQRQKHADVKASLEVSHAYGIHGSDDSFEHRGEGVPIATALLLCL